LMMTTLGSCRGSWSASALGDRGRLRAEPCQESLRTVAAIRNYTGVRGHVCATQTRGCGFRSTAGLAPFAPLPDTRDDVELASTGVPIGRDGHVGTREAAIVTRFASKLGLEKSMVRSKRDPSQTGKIGTYAFFRKQLRSIVNGRGRTRGGLIVSTTCSSPMTPTRVNPCHTDQLVNVPAAIH